MTPREPSSRDRLAMLVDERDRATRTMAMGIERMLDAYLDDEDIRPGLEMARQGALAFEKFIMGTGPMPTCLFNPVIPQPEEDQ